MQDKTPQGEEGISPVTTGDVVTDFTTGGESPNFLAIAPLTHQLLNISTRGLVGTRDDV